MNPITLIVFLPLLAAIIAGLGGRLIGNLPAKLLTTGALFASCALSWPIFLSFVAGDAQASVTPVLEWVRSGDLVFDWALRVDTLTAVMLVVVTSVSALVHLYSWGYMAEDDSQPRFFAYLSLFTFAMLMLVTADNLVQMFFGWEGVGLASYLLIGFWYHKPSANAAAIKAFVVNRVGDLGFMLGIFGTFLVFGTVSIPAILEAAPGMAGSTIGFLGMRLDTMTILCLLLFIGAMGKSAQLGLHTWLPDAMEGPTPVSALIHAATMVTAGVFMVCRLSPMFEAAPVAQGFVIFIGAATCLFAATVATTQHDIKRVIAYSTCSQLGYMFVAAGVGAYGAAMFHLFTHAFFKALLFLGAGSVIHAMHHEQDMRYYGALRRHIPLTFWVMVAGTLAITGVGIIGVFGFAGFYSKDAILEAAFASGPHGQWAFGVGAFAALLTSFYSWRLIFLTFFGKKRWEQSDHIQHATHSSGHGHSEYRPHESPASMLVPLILLSIGAIFAGFGFHEQFVGAQAGAAFWDGSIAFNTHLMHAAHQVPLWVKLTPAAVMVLGLAIAWRNYIRDPGAPARFVAALPWLHRFLFNKWYFDEMYDALFVRPASALGRLFWHGGDEGVIDRFGPNGVALAVAGSAQVASRLQSGFLYSYAFVMLLGLAALVTWVMVAFQ
ncbi:MAG: NADH-quinone oxidoreductase subunit L [Pseudomonadota bacterium]